jgi:exopolysaccharide production protein ExoZ
MIRPIQYLRALAALSVVWGHSLYIVPGIAERLGPSWFGPAGVDLFFVISGFIMVVTTAGGDVTPQKFLALRIIRVVPLYWLATLAWIGFVAFEGTFTNPHPPAAIAKSLLFVPYISPGSPSGVWPILQNGWTLNYEMFFYVLFALSLAAPARVRIAGLAATLGLLVVAGRLFGPFANALAFTYTSPYLLEFVAGMILAHGWLQSEPRNSLPHSLFLIVFGCYCIGGLHSRPMILGGAFLIVAGCLDPRIRAIQSRPLLLLGNASYSIYLFHPFVLEALAPTWVRLFPLATTLSSVLFVALAVLLSALAGCLCYWLIEKPILFRLRNLVKASGAATSQALESPRGTG